jgi:hypothetical protein
VIFPQVFTAVSHPSFSQPNWALPDASLGVSIGVREIIGATHSAQTESFRTFGFLIAAFDPVPALRTVWSQSDRHDQGPARPREHVVKRSKAH